MRKLYNLFSVLCGSKKKHLALGPQWINFLSLCHLHILTVVMKHNLCIIKIMFLGPLKSKARIL